MLREFEDRRNNSKPRSKKPSVERKSSVERMIDDFHRSLPPPLSSETKDPNANSTMTTTATGVSSKRPSKNGTMNSQISNWSVASSTASFDYQPAKSGSPNHNGLKRGKSSDLPSVDEDLEPHGERMPPEGSSSSSGVSPTNFVQRIEIKEKSPKVVRKTERRKSTKEEAAPMPPPPPPLPPMEDEISDDFSNLRRLISEGRIAGLDAKPPSFTPPSPPSSNSRRPSSAKPSAPITPKSTPKSTHSAERQPSRKSREAPKPPNVVNRQREPSLEDLTQMTSKKRSEVKRSSSNHGSRPSGTIIEILVDIHVIFS